MRPVGRATPDDLIGSYLQSGDAMAPLAGFSDREDTGRTDTLTQGVPSSR